MLACGLAARAILFASEPVLEDDYQRYLWDGAVTAQGLNPMRSRPRMHRTRKPIRRSDGSPRNPAGPRAHPL